jgi:hypothetical protein
MSSLPRTGIGVATFAADLLEPEAALTPVFGIEG